MKPPRPMLVVFIDSLPFRCLPQLPFLNSLAGGPLKPGFGYSMNIKAQIFAGLNPDRLGQLCSWQPTANASLGFRLLSRLAPFERSAFARLWLHRLGTRLVRKPLFAVPLRLLRWFDYREINAYEPAFPHPTVLSDPTTTRVLYSQFRPGPDRDARLFAAANERAAAPGLLFVASADLDHIGHAVGVGSPVYDDYLQRLDGWLAQLAERHQATHPGAPLVVFSDHGMANVTGAVDPAVEKHFGPMRPDRYLCAADATMARFWSPDRTLAAELAAYARGVAGGAVLSAAERQTLGAADPAFGETIWLLREGLVFCPSFYFYRPPAAMHGYHPDEPDQTAFVATRGAPGERPRDVNELHAFLRRLTQERA